VASGVAPVAAGEALSESIGNAFPFFRVLIL
jgi:hypothetical protein